NRVFSGTVSQRGQSFTLTGGEAPERVSVAGVSSDSWSTLGVQTVLGRTFNAEEERLGSESGVALISHKLWQRRFGGDPGMLGKSLALDERSYTVVGVLPQGYNFPYDADIWVPARIDPSRDDDSAVFARLKPGVSLEQARAEMKQIAAKIVQQYPDT